MMKPTCTLFCAGATGQPAWFTSLTPQLTGLRLGCVWPPNAPQQGWDPRWATWDEDAIRAALVASGFALWFLDSKGTPAPGFQRELRIGRALWKEGALRGMAYIDVMRPSYIAHDAPAGMSESISLAVQCVPGASRTVLAPRALPGYLASRFLPLMLEDDTSDVAEDTALLDDVHVAENESDVAPLSADEEGAKSAEDGSGGQ